MEKPQVCYIILVLLVASLVMRRRKAPEILSYLGNGFSSALHQAFLLSTAADDLPTSSWDP